MYKDTNVSNDYDWSAGIFPGNTPPRSGIEPGPRRGQTAVRYVYFPTELSWLTENAITNITPGIILSAYLRPRESFHKEFGHPCRWESTVFELVQDCVGSQIAALSFPAVSDRWPIIVPIWTSVENVLLSIFRCRTSSGNFSLPVYRSRESSRKTWITDSPLTRNIDQWQKG